jgi:hypothetical protein
MAISGDTGNGATLTFAANMGFGTATTSLSMAIDITQGEQTVGVIDTSTLSTAGSMESIPSDLAEFAESSANFKWLTSAASTVAMNAVLPASAGTVLLTYPIRTGETTAATYSGTGYITGHTPPSLANGQLQTGSVKWKYDGDTEPTYTKAT